MGGCVTWFAQKLGRFGVALHLRHMVCLICGRVVRGAVAVGNGIHIAVHALRQLFQLLQVEVGHVANAAHVQVVRHHALPVIPQRDAVDLADQDGWWGVGAKEVRTLCPPKREAKCAIDDRFALCQNQRYAYVSAEIARIDGPGKVRSGLAVSSLKTELPNNLV